jgi:peptidoglycan-N-acetylglucosamine deacetylase
VVGRRGYALAGRRRHRLPFVVALAAVAAVAWLGKRSTDEPPPVQVALPAQPQPPQAAGRDGAGPVAAAGVVERPAPPPPATVPRAVELAIPPDVSVRHAGSGRPLVALTFDDGPSPYTDRILDVLARYDAKATFFVIGRQIAERPKTVRRISAEGHAIGNHTWSHASLPQLPARGRRRQLERTNAAIRTATGASPALVRPPYEMTTPTVNRQARRLGLLPVVWSVDPGDWRLRAPWKVARRVLDKARPGAIIVLHDGGGDRSTTVAALPKILDGLRQKGLVPVTVPQLLAAAPPDPHDDSLLHSREHRPSARPGHNRTSSATRSQEAHE